MKILLSIIISALLFLGSSAYAAKEPKVDDVNVINTPDVYIVGGVEIINDDTNPIPVTIENGGTNGQTAIEWRFVGVTSFETTGNIDFGAVSGYSAMNIACDFDFGGGQGARACTSEEIRHSIVPDTDGFAWINPTTTERLVKPDGSLGIYDPHVSRSIAFGSISLDCGGWGTSSAGNLHYGLVVVSSSGSMDMLPLNCSSTRSIACCAPIAVTVQ